MFVGSVALPVFSIKYNSDHESRVVTSFVILRMANGDLSKE